MMKHTHFLEYCEIKNTLPKISNTKKQLVDEICSLYKEQDDVYSAKYPNVRKTGRPLDASKTATVDIYLEGELLTYSEKTLNIFKNYLLNLKSDNENIVIQIIDNIVKAYGYNSLDDAESKL